MAWCWLWRQFRKTTLISLKWYSLNRIPKRGQWQGGLDGEEKIRQWFHIQGNQTQVSVKSKRSQAQDEGEARKARRICVPEASLPPTWSRPWWHGWIIQRPVKQWVASSSTWGKREGRPSRPPHRYSYAPGSQDEDRASGSQHCLNAGELRKRPVPAVPSTGSDFTRVGLRHWVFFNSSRRF